MYFIIMPVIGDTWEQFGLICGQDHALQFAKIKG